MIAKALPSEAVVDEIQHAYTAIHALASHLGTPHASAALGAAAVAQWAAELDTTLAATPHERQWRAHVRKIVSAFGARLFACDDHPRLPRTNNDMEQALRVLSTRERRCTGRKHVGPKLVRITGLVGAADLLVRAADALERIVDLPHACRRGFQPRRTRLARPRGQALSFRRAPAAFLAMAEKL